MIPVRCRFFLVFAFFALVLVPPSDAGDVPFNDEVGRIVPVPFPPGRIVSLAPNVTEILFGLGLDEEIIGVSVHCDYPEKARTRPRVGSYTSLDFERIVSLRPDLIIATGAGNTRDMVKRLEKLGVPTYVIFPRNMDEIFRSIVRLGKVVNRERASREIVETMRRRREKVVDLTRGSSRPRVFLQIGEAPMVTVGKGSFGHDLIRLAGGENVAENEGKMYPRINVEEILKRSPEVIIVSSMNPNGDYDRILREWTRWKMIPAVKNGRVHLINSDLVDRPSLRIIDGLEEMARLIHPEKFTRSMQNSR